MGIRQRRGILLALSVVFVIVVIAAVFVLVATVRHGEKAVVAVYPSAVAGSKKGVGVTSGTVAEVAQLNVSWGYNWGLSGAWFNDAWEYVPMAHKGTDSDRLARAAKNRPGSYWLVWNEPDQRTQENLQPAAAAVAYKRIYDAITGADPTAKLIVGGVSAPTSAGYGWVRQFRGAYYTRYKVWPKMAGLHVHNYLLQSYGTKAWRDALYMFRRWMDADRVGGELWLTEYGCLKWWQLCGRVMTEQTPWLEAQPWLHRYVWFATGVAVPSCQGCYGSLLYGGALTDLGELYAKY